VDSRELLVEAINSVPVPGAPPRFSRAGSWIGLAFLETALRQNHVRRLTESLSFTEHRAAERSVQLDLSLGLLDDIQLEAGRTYSQMRGGNLSDIPAEEKPLLWVPIARLSRQSTSPVDVIDASGLRVPLLTQYETSRLIAAGLYRLLRSILGSDAKSTKEGSLDDLLHTNDRARWLLQTAILTLLFERSKPTSARTISKPTAPARTGEPAACRKLVFNVLEERAELLSEYFQLFTVALRYYLVVVGLPSSKDEHHLEYRVPLTADPEEVRNRLASFLRQLAPARRGYRVRYYTSIPPTMRSYHLVAETEPGLDIVNMVMSCEADSGIAEQIRHDLTYLSDRLVEQRRTVPTGGRDRILELELGTTLRSLSQLHRRRRWDAEQIGGSLRAEILESTEALSTASVEGLLHPDEGGKYTSSLLIHPSIKPEVLSDAASELGTCELSRDVCQENDPKTNRAHAYWRRHVSHETRTGPIQTRCSIVIVDSAAGRAKSVGWFVVSVLGLTLALGAMVYESPGFWQWDSHGISTKPPEAVIGVLLIVPGYIYSRLDMPSRYSISARLRLLPRLAAYATIATVALLAGYVAVGPSMNRLRWGFWLALLIQGVCATALLLRRRRPRSGPRIKDTEYRVPDLPRWLDDGQPAPDPERSTDRLFDASFHAVGAESAGSAGGS
jgi:hypothetical protein